MRLKDKVALITGAASGMGRTAANLFAAEGAKVVIADVTARTGEEAAQEIKSTGGQAAFVRADVSPDYLLDLSDHHPKLRNRKLCIRGNSQPMLA